MTLLARVTCPFCGSAAAEFVASEGNLSEPRRWTVDVDQKSARKVQRMQRACADDAAQTFLQILDFGIRG
jgi:hypothetical protein